MTLRSTFDSAASHVSRRVTASLRWLTDAQSPEFHRCPLTAHGGVVKWAAQNLRHIFHHWASTLHGEQRLPEPVVRRSATWDRLVSVKVTFPSGCFAGRLSLSRHFACSHASRHSTASGLPKCLSMMAFSKPTAALEMKSGPHASSSFSYWAARRRLSSAR